MARLGGCAVVVCATRVADAQDTYRYLQRLVEWPRAAGAAADACPVSRPLPRTGSGAGRTQLAQARSVRAPTACGGHHQSPGRSASISMPTLWSATSPHWPASSSAPGRLWSLEQTWQNERPCEIPPRPHWIRARGPRLASCVLTTTAPPCCPTPGPRRTPLPPAGHRPAADPPGHHHDHPARAHTHTWSSIGSGPPQATWTDRLAAAARATPGPPARRGTDQQRPPRCPRTTVTPPRPTCTGRS
ncbi:hypothetical protein SCHAM137S_06539 [Streptomyces chartreusis]